MARLATMIFFSLWQKRRKNGNKQKNAAQPQLKSLLGGLGDTFQSGPPVREGHLTSPAGITDVFL